MLNIYLYLILPFTVFINVLYFISPFLYLLEDSFDPMLGFRMTMTRVLASCCNVLPVTRYLFYSNLVFIMYYLPNTVMHNAYIPGYFLVRYEFYYS